MAVQYIKYCIYNTNNIYLSISMLKVGKGTFIFIPYAFCLALLFNLWVFLFLFIFQKFGTFMFCQFADILKDSGYTELIYFNEFKLNSFPHIAAFEIYFIFMKLYWGIIDQKKIRQLQTGDGGTLK